jgi:N-acetylmuramoyl-L-alanine amidase/type II secretory pathway predicted ATPase ExeA
MFFEFFGFRQQPFGVTPDPTYLYPSRTHCEALDSLTEGILGGRGFLALIAEPGMGKTTLLYQVLEGLRDTARSAYLFQTQCDFKEFFQYLLSELGVDASGMGLVAMHNKLNEMLFAELLAGRRFVLIVDEAQNLDNSVLETIRLLSNFETSKTKLLQIVLAGQPQLGEKLAQKELAQLLQRITVVKHLQALSPEETAGYIRHRLKVAGYCGEQLFETEALWFIAEASQGVPRRINSICFQTLADAFALGQRTIGVEIVREAAAKLGFDTAAPLSARAATAGADGEAVQTLPRQTEAEPAETSDVSGSAQTPLQTPPHLTYKPLSRFGLPPWVVWGTALAGILLAGGALLPGSVPARTLWHEAGAAIRARKNILWRVSADGRAKASHARQPAAAIGATNGHATASVTDIETLNGENGPRVVVTLDGTVDYDSARIPSPDRIYFDLHNARLSPALEHTLRAQDSLPDWVHAAQNKGDVVRLVFGAAGAKDYFAQMLSNPERLVIDIHTGAGSQAPAAGATADTEQAEDTPAAPDVNQSSGQPSLIRELGLKINRIVIDPGHGGNDTGTIGPHGLLEKDLCLDVALRLGQLIEKNVPNAEVIYTRTTDAYVPLEERTAIANRNKADLFISIHANSSDSEKTRGVETYYLNFASSPDSIAVATRENAHAQSSVHDLPELLEKIAHTEKIADSKQLATDIQNALAHQLQTVSGRETNRGVKQAPFIVLTGADMPSVLSEISFVSNPSDESLLREIPQRERVAEGLYHGIAAYLNTLQSLPNNKQRLLSENRLNTTARTSTAAGAAQRASQ